MVTVKHVKAYVTVVHVAYVALESTVILFVVLMWVEWGRNYMGVNVG